MARSRITTAQPSNWLQGWLMLILKQGEACDRDNAFLKSVGFVWGQAFQVEGDAAMPYLNTRECELGGYRSTLSTFYPRDSSLAPFLVVTYIATPSNKYWLGESPLPAIADQIIDSSGNSGHNVEYLLRLAEFLKLRIPEASDEHLFALEVLVRERISERNLCLNTLMGANISRSHRDEVEHVVPPQPIVPAVASPTQFSNMVPSKKLRCVNI